MPKIPGLRWGAITNFKADKDKLQELDKMMPNDKKWHILFETPDFMHFDGVPIKKKDWSSMT